MGKDGNIQQHESKSSLLFNIKSIIITYTTAAEFTHIFHVFIYSCIRIGLIIVLIAF